MLACMRACCLIALVLSIFASPARPQSALLVISLDGMRPDYVLKADEHGLKIPHLRRILAEGAHASGVRGVLPTVTYPSHTTILTGVWPNKHGIYSNVVSDPLGKNMDGWYWYAEDIRVPTLWEAAANAGMKVGSVSWPVSVLARGVTYLIPEYWRAQKTPDDLKLMRAISTPGLINEIEKQAGPYIMDLDAAVDGDRQRTRYAIAILREKKVQFMTVHLAALDHIEHASGPFSPEANAALEQLDQQVADLEAAAKSAHNNVTVCVLSDHGFARTDHSLNLLKPFADAGLVTLSASRKITEWKAWPKADGGSASVLIHDPHDEATRSKVRELLHHLAADPNNGINQILDAREIATLRREPRGVVLGRYENQLLSGVEPGASRRTEESWRHARLSSVASRVTGVILHCRTQHQARPGSRPHRHAQYRPNPRRLPGSEVHLWRSPRALHIFRH